MEKNVDSLFQKVLNSLPASIAVLNGDGIIEITNASWDKMNAEIQGDLRLAGRGANYLKACEDEGGKEHEAAMDALEGLRSVLEGRSTYFSMEYPVQVNSKKQWFLMATTPLHPPQTGVLVSHTNITERRKIEEDQNLLINNIQLLAMTDSLTGLENRRSIENKLHAELNRAARANQNMTIMLADIDDLKGINDTHGHRYGDLALKEAARVMMACKRDYDCIGRYGGDEFLLIFPDTLPGKAAGIGERFRKAVNKLKIPPDAEDGRKVSISVGYYEIKPTLKKEQPVEEFVDRADKALYQAKVSGKNKVVSYKEMPKQGSKSK